MKGFKTRKQIEREPKSKEWSYGIVKRTKEKYQIAVIQHGSGYEPIITLEMPESESHRFFFDLYLQLKEVFKNEDRNPGHH